MQIRTIIIVVFILLLVAPAAFSQSAGQADWFKQAEQQRQEGNYKDALGLYARVIEDENADSEHVGTSLQNAVDCLRRLGRIDEADALLEKAVGLHNQDWVVSQYAANAYTALNHSGSLIAGEFVRGGGRSGGQYVSSYARDRVRALQLMKQALDLMPADADKNDVSTLCFRFTDILYQIQGQKAYWTLQYATDLETLPDYETGNAYYDYQPMNAPVDENGGPVFFYPPDSFDKAANDGERLYWLLDYAAKINPQAKNEAAWKRAMIGYWNFGVQTMAGMGILHPVNEKEFGEGPFSVHTLSEDETMAALATGVKRFTLPREHNHIFLFQQIAKAGGDHSQGALEMLAHVFENRRQYPKAVKYRQEIIERFPGSKEKQQEELEQITDAMGNFHAVPAQPAGKEAEVGFLFRNGKTVHFRAERINLQQYLEDEKENFRKSKDRPEWFRFSIHELLATLTNKDDSPYIVQVEAEWDLALDPLPDHFDKRIMVKTPLKKAGAYLLTAKMESGYTTCTIVWIMDSALLKKSMDGREMFFTADAVTGEPLQGMKINCFGYKWNHRQRRYETLEFDKKTDRNGMAYLPAMQVKSGYQWIISASDNDGRFAYFAASAFWRAASSREELNRTRAFGITDRPVYRPGQTVHYKFWVRQAKYGLGEESAFAGMSMEVKGKDPQRADILHETIIADEYGGVEGEYTLPDEAPLGVYSIRINKRESLSFRVEEYKKPEFEVTIKAPEEPIALGETIPIEIQADYYFGAPVVQARVSYKILRSEYNQQWFPRGAWDWLYGAGYWWFSYDYDWYPGWAEWGCHRPRWSWWWHGSTMPPEVVAEGKGLTDENGVLKLSIDTALAKELHGDADHRYEVAVEVTDQSRRTIVGKGAVIAAREPFKVHAWVNKGHYQVGDVVKADFSARTPDGMPVSGQGKAVLYKITRKNGKPSEKAVEKWDLKIGDDGRAELKLDASQAGQYRLSLSVTDAKGRTREGGYVFYVMGDKDTGRNFVFDHLELTPDLREYAPGDKVRLRINTRAKDSTVLLFVRPENGVYPKPKILRIKRKQHGPGNQGG